ncbi:hypothetical protein OBP_301 [Pseudomonas phage OBP]|uniref:hypothetical protein n=1 Tax=Pseudomonas phage OBP TaxID=1124849 RepID=UPI000240D648|nr:hypothetical protein OBP_301 [Pseudomonas phage OBP]AEV89738.1 hypothetical protein OBP_301 [Pseudomonas phage OBP]
MTWVKRTYKRDWLQRSPYLNTVSFRHELSNQTRWEIKPESIDKNERKLTWADDYYPVEEMIATFELVFSIGSEIIKLHANDFIGPSDALKDYVRKITLIKEVIGHFIRDYKSFHDKDAPFIIKEFLNSSEGPSAIYTSTIAISCSSTHSFFFEIGSCDDKARLYIEKEKDFLEMLIKLQKFLSGAITDAQAALDTYKGRL